MRADSFAGRLVRALARDTPAYRPGAAPAPEGFRGRLAAALARSPPAYATASAQESPAYATGSAQESPAPPAGDGVAPLATGGGAARQPVDGPPPQAAFERG